MTLYEFIEKFNINASEKVGYIVFYISCILGVTPWVDSKTGKPKYELFNRIYAGVFMSLNFTIISIYLVYKTDNRSDNPIEKFFSLCNLILVIFLFITVTVRSLMNSKAVGKMLRIRAELTMSLRKSSVKGYFLDKFFFQFLLGHVIYGVVMYSLGRTMIGLHDGILNWISLAVPEYYCLLLTIYCCNMILIIAKVFGQLNKQLSDTASFDGDKVVMYHIKEIRKKCLDTHETIHLFNHLQGWNLFLMFIFMQVQILRCANWILSFQEELSWDVTPLLVIGLLRFVSIPFMYFKRITY